MLPPVTPLSAENRAWVDGVLAGIFSRTEQPVVTSPAPTVEPPSEARATVVWASQTGTVEEYAHTCAEQLSQTGFSVRLRGAEEVSITDLSGTVLFVVATTGDGDPPDNGIALWDALAAAEPGDLDDLEFTVLGFGDSSYADFCGFARKLDARLEHLGARRVIDRALCEPDFEETARAWTGQVTAFLDSPESGQIETKPAASQPLFAAKSTSHHNRSQRSALWRRLRQGRPQHRRSPSRGHARIRRRRCPGCMAAQSARHGCRVPRAHRPGWFGRNRTRRREDAARRRFRTALGHHPDHSRSCAFRPRAPPGRRLTGRDRRSRALRRVGLGPPDPRPVGPPPGQPRSSTNGSRYSDR